MSRHRFRSGAVAGLLVLAFTLVAWGDRLVLNDGRVIEGTVIKQGERYWVKSTDGTTQYISLTDVKTLEKGNGAPKIGEPPTAMPGSGSVTGFSSSLAATQRKANAVDDPISAVSIWQSFIDSKPSANDLKVAKDELARWQKIADDGAEKINGRWVTGDEYKTLKAKILAMRKEISELLKNHETLRATTKLEELRKIYPNDVHVTFYLGFIEMEKNNWDKASIYFEQVLKAKPNMPEAMANIAVSMWFKRKYPEAVVQMDKAAKQGDSKEIAFDLCAMLNDAPRAFVQGQAGKAAVEDAHLLASKYNIPEGSTRGTLYFIPPREESSGSEGHEKGGLVVGTGFILLPDGLILTNRHVVQNSKSLMVVINGKLEKAAEIVKIDDQQDLALIRLTNNSMKLPTVQLAPADLPPHGAECTVIGYPLFGRLGSSLKITHGIVSSAGNADGASSKLFGMNALGTDEIDVMVDAKVNPGNSGGPIVDKNGNIMAIVCMKTISSETEDSYGMGISSGRIRRFLAKNNVAIPTGEAGKVALSVEDIATKIEPATVLILNTRLASAH